MISDIEIDLETKRLMSTHKFIDLYHDNWLVCKVCKLPAIMFSNKILPLYEDELVLKNLSCNEIVLKYILE